MGKVEGVQNSWVLHPAWYFIRGTGQVVCLHDTSYFFCHREAVRSSKPFPCALANATMVLQNRVVIGRTTPPFAIWPHLRLCRSNDGFLQALGLSSNPGLSEVKDKAPID